MSKLFAKKLLDDVVTMTSNAGTSHVGGCLSCLDIISVLFSQIINIDKKNLKFKENRLVFVFIALSIVLFLTFKMAAFPLTILLYIFIKLFRIKI